MVALLVHFSYLQEVSLAGTASEPDAVLNDDDTDPRHPEPPLRRGDPGREHHAAPVDCSVAKRLLAMTVDLDLVQNGYALIGYVGGSPMELSNG